MDVTKEFRMNTKAVIRKLMWVIAIGAMALLTQCTFWDAYKKPLGPTLEIVEPLETLDIPAIIATATPVPETPTATPTSGPTEVCGETSAWNVLILGSDVIAMRGDKGSDFVRMMRVDFPNKKVVVYAFPRELWVNTSGLGFYYPTVDSTELGTVFYEAYRRSANANQREKLADGTNIVSKMLMWNFVLRTDHYLTADLTQMPAMVDAVGGLPIYIPQRITDPWIGMVFEPGQQTLNGAQVAAYARAKPDSDFGRITRQQGLMEAARQKLTEPAVWAKIPQLYTQFNQVIATDLSLEQINHLACLMNEVPRESIAFEGVRQEWISPGPQGSYLWDKSSVLSQLMGLGLIP
jgi:LCP family protein required for cell wall assembly